jgi:predicted DNA-binding transcriptional regulator YafY
VIVCPETYKIPANFNAVDSINSAWGFVAEGELITVKLHFKSNVSKMVLSTVWHPSQRFEIQNDDSIIATFKVRNIADFRKWVLSWGNDVEVLEPEAFREGIVDLLKALLDQYSSQNDLLPGGWVKSEEIFQDAKMSTKGVLA